MRFQVTIILAVVMVVSVSPSHGFFTNRTSSILEIPSRFLTNVKNATEGIAMDVQENVEHLGQNLKEVAAQKQNVIMSGIRSIGDIISERKAEVFGTPIRTFGSFGGNAGGPLAAFFTNIINSFLANLGPAFFTRLLGLSRDLDLVAGNEFRYDDLMDIDDITTISPEATSVADLRTTSSATESTPAAIENPQHDNVYVLFPTPSDLSSSTPLNILAYKSQPLGPVIVSTDSPAANLRQQEVEVAPVSNLPTSSRTTPSSPSTTSWSGNVLQ